MVSVSTRLVRLSQPGHDVLHPVVAEAEPDMAEGDEGDGEQVAPLGRVIAGKEKHFGNGKTSRMKQISELGGT